MIVTASPMGSYDAIIYDEGLLIIAQTGNGTPILSGPTRANDKEVLGAALAYVAALGGGHVLCKSNVSIVGIDIPTNVHLELSYGVTVIPSEDADIFTLCPRGKLSGGNIDTTGIAFSHRAILLEGRQGETPNHNYQNTDETCIEDIRLVGTAAIGSGSAICFNADDGCWGHVCSVTTQHIRIKGFEAAIALDVGTPANYVNSNIFHDIKIEGSCYGIRETGATVAAMNKYSKIEYQPFGGTGIAAAVINGAMEELDLEIWDWPYDVSRPGVILTSASLQNDIKTYGMAYVQNLGSTSPKTKNEIHVFYGQGIARYTVAPQTSPSRQLNADFTTLSAAIASASAALVRGDITYAVIEVYGDINEANTIAPVNGIKIYGHDSTITIAGGFYGVNLINLTNFYMSGTKFIHANPDGLNDRLALRTYNLGPGCVIEDCSFTNACAGFRCHGLAMSGTGGGTFRRCKFQGASAMSCSGASLESFDEVLPPIFEECEAIGGAGPSGHGWVLAGMTFATLRRCLGKDGVGDATNPAFPGAAYYITGCASPRLEYCSVSHDYAKINWSYRAADGGKFATSPLWRNQLVGCVVKVNVAQVGKTLCIGTSEGGAQVAAGIDIGSLGYKYFSFLKVIAPYLYVTPSDPIEDGSISIIANVMRANLNHYGAIIDTKGSASLFGCDIGGV